MNITKIPTKFVKEIKCIMDDGEVIVINEIQEVMSDGNPYTCVMDFLETLDFSNRISNIKVKMDHPFVEKHIDNMVDSILEKSKNSGGEETAC